MNLKKLITTTVATALSAALVTGCAMTNDPGVSDTISPVWSVGEEFHVKSVYRLLHVKNSEFGESHNLAEEFLPGMFSAETPEDEAWTAPVVWRFTVLQSQWLPDPASVFYPYSFDKSGDPATLTILQAVAPKELNANPVAYELDPIFYIVVREGDLKVRAVSFNYLSNGGDRLTRTVEFGDKFNREAASDTPVFILPYLMPAFPLKVDSYTDTIGAGEAMYVGRSGDASVDVSFRASMDKSMVEQGWEAGAPWFSYSFTPNMRAWLMSDVEVAMLADEVGAAPGSVTGAIINNDEQTISEAFGHKIDLNAELRVEAGTDVGRAAPGYIPWGGSWWPQRSGKLVFGWNNSSTPSIAVRSEVDPLMAEIQTLGDWLRANDRGTSEWNDKYSEYTTKREAVSDILDDFYGELKGKITNGDIALDDVNSWSPMDKVAFYLHATGEGGSNPYKMGGWELSNHYSPTGASWWGHCNGWAAAAILINEPREPVTFTVPNPQGGADINVTFQSADLKGLATESHYSTLSVFYGERYNDEDDNIKDLTPDAFHRLMSYYLKAEGFPFVFDITAGDEVWNYPVYEYDMDITLARDIDPGTISVNTASVAELDAMPGLGVPLSERIIEERGAHGPFTSMQDVADRVSGIGPVTIAGLEGYLSVDGHRKEFNVSAFVKFADDAVGETHLDDSPSSPETLTRTWRYTLLTTPDGVVISGEWENDNEHPDFAWVPYSNTEWSSGSENSHLKWNDIKALFSVREYAPTGCSSDSECGAGETCNVFTRACEGGAPPPPPPGGDSFEPNNDIGSAASISDGTVSAEISAGGDEDWFAINTSAGATLNVTISFSNAAGDLDAKLVDATGDSIDSSTSTSDSESLSVTASADAIYYVRVYGYSGATNSYTITVAGASGGGFPPPPPPPGGNATDEPNESAADANPVGAGTYSGLSISSATDEDWFVVSLPGGGSITASIDFSNATGDLDFALVDVAGGSLDTSTSTSDTETVGATGLAAGNYYLRAYGYSGATGAYTLTVTVD